jgi:hypothetical protein
MGSNYSGIGTVITGGVNGGANAAGGRLVVRSVLDTQLPTAGNSSEYEDRYSFQMIESGVSLASGNSCMARERSKYNFGRDLTVGDGCMWSTYNRLDDLLAQGKGSNEKHLQNYQWNGTLVVGTSNYGWNVTGGADSDTVWNRSLGKPNDDTPQASNLSKATKLNDDSFLLGLQELTVRWNTQDTNINRPQLQTAHRRTGDDFGGVIPTDDKSIDGKIARTGQKEL